MQINKHGSFYIRNGWPTKIMDALSEDIHIFSPNNELSAVDSIGVGRIMIKSMRYWAVVLGLAQEEKDQQGICDTLTQFAVELCENDPYCTDSGTLWLLHRNLSRNMADATAWNWAFNAFGAQIFTKEEFVSAFYAYIQREGGTYTKKAVEKEFDCFKNTYVSDKDFSIGKIIEENTVPFFAPLKLLEYKGGGYFARRKISSKEIPLDIFLLCIILDNIEHLERNRQISIDHLLEDENQVCKYMNAGYSTLIELLQQLENAGHLTLINNFGDRHIELGDVDAEALLSNYYQRIGG